MTILERVKKVIDWLVFEGAVKNRRELSEKLGYTESSLSQIINGKVALSDRFINNLSNADKRINALWLKTGAGNMTIEPGILREAQEIQTECSSEIGIAKICYSQNRGVPYYNVDFIGGFDLIINDQTATSEYNIDFKKYNDADCWCNITGHSMEPEITHGDIIALKKIEDWRTFLPYGEVYGIVTQEHRTIKRVTGSDKEGFLKLIPTNTAPEYAPQDIPVSVILHVYKVLGCMKRL